MARTCQCGECGGANTSHTAGGEKFDLCLFFVCFCLFFLSVTLVNGSVCANGNANKPFELRNSFEIFGVEKVCSCKTEFNFVSASLGGAIRQCRI